MESIKGDYDVRKDIERNSANYTKASVKANKN